MEVPFLLEELRNLLLWLTLACLSKYLDQSGRGLKNFARTDVATEPPPFKKSCIRHC